MLKKLIRHEWLATWKIPAVALGCAALLSGACALFFSKLPPAGPDIEMNVGNLIIFILYVFISGVIPLLVTLYMAIRFYKNMYTDEGYLMHTLPVSPRQLILSKTTIAVFWSYLGSLLTLVTVLPVSLLAVPRIGYVSAEEFTELSQVYLLLFGGSLPSAVFYLIPCLIVSGLANILLIYAAVSLGQLFGRHKVLGSIICYLGINVMMTTASSLFMLPDMAGLVIRTAQNEKDFFGVTMPAYMRSSYFSSFVIDVVLSVVFFFLTEYLMKKNLNLD